MRNVLIVAFVIMLLPLALAQEEDYENAGSLTAEVTIEGHADITFESNRTRVESAVVNLSLFPRNGKYQSVSALESSPDAVIDGSVMSFRFSNPLDEINYRVDAKVIVGDSFAAVKKKIAFPLVSLPDEIIPYTKPTEIIDSDDPAINKVASDLVSGEDDLYGAVYEIARWTRENVNYNLSSVTADVSQKASWVLLERKGVCDEITSLFIALLRSVGIPAKFVTGYAYTNSPLFPENWGAHGWAEVYFPGYGWVPFDITYGQFGWVDPTHITMQESLDPDTASTRYEWVGRDAELSIKELDIDVEVLATTGVASPFVRIEARPLREEIRDGSYNAIEARVQNLRDSYVMAELLLSVPKEVKIMGKSARDVMLRPLEERSVFWIVTLDSDLEKNFLYTFPISVKSGRNAIGESAFKAAIDSPLYSLSEIGGIIDQNEEESEKVYSSNLAISCSPSKKTLYAYEEGRITCALKNTGNTPLSQLKVCLAKDCDALDMGIAKSEEVEFPIDTKRIGKREERITARNDKVSKGVDVGIEVLDAPGVGISGIAIPSSVAFDEEVALSFMVGKVSYSRPENLTITVELAGGERGWTVDRLTDNQSLSLAFEGRDLRKGENLIVISVTHYDGNGREYKSAREVMILLENVTFFQGVQLWVRDMGAWAQGLIE